MQTAKKLTTLPLDPSYIESRQAKEGFAGVPHQVTADTRLSDEGFRLLAALESWAWNKPLCYPSNKDLAIRAGWLTKSGRPAISKVKRVLADLEGKTGRRPYIRRVIISTPGMRDRDRIEMLRPFGVACKPSEGCGPNLGHPSPKMGHKKESPEYKEEQRIQLESEFSAQSHEGCCAPSLSSDPVVPEDDNAVQREQRDRMTTLARQLGSMSHGDMSAEGIVDEFADVSLKVVLDGDTNREYHCGVGWALFENRLSVASLLGIINDFATKHDNLELYHEPGWYVSKVDPMILPKLEKPRRKRRPA